MGCPREARRRTLKKIPLLPKCGVPLIRELDRFTKFRVRRFRIVYVIHYKARTTTLMGVGHRKSLYEERTARFRKQN
ncbi:MAG: cytotoxin [Nitrospirota bacterium]